MQATTLFDVQAIPAADTCCLGPATRTLCADFIWRPVGDLVPGDELIAFDGFAKAGHRRHMRIATVLTAPRCRRLAYRVSFTDGREVITSSEHQWLTDPSSCWIYTRNIAAGRPVRDLGVPWEVEDSWEAGWLGGVFDGEASLSPCTVKSKGSGWQITFAQNEGAVLDLAEHLCKKRGYESRKKIEPHRDVRRLVITGIYDCLRFLGECRPVRLMGRSRPWIESRTPTRSRGTARSRQYNATVREVEFLGERDLIAIETTTQTLLTEGLLSSLVRTPMKPSRHP